MGKKSDRKRAQNKYKDCGCKVSNTDCGCDQVEDRVEDHDCGCHKECSCDQVERREDRDCGCHKECHCGTGYQHRGRRGSRRKHEELADLQFEAKQDSSIKQNSQESIYVIDSYDVTVDTTDTQVAVSLQAALQVAITIVINITIADSTRAQQITEELLQKSQIKQSNQQLLCIEGSENVTITTTDTDVGISIQVLLQILVVLVAQIGIL